MSRVITEFDDIFEPSHQPNRRATARPARVTASKKFIDEVRIDLELEGDQAVKVADWIVDKMDRYAASAATPVFDMEGNGPQCSYCGVPWPICGHQHMSAALDKDDDQ